MKTNVSQCRNIELAALSDIINEQRNILADNTNTTVMDLTVMFDINEVRSMSEELSILTNTSAAIVPNDLNTVNNLIEEIVRLASKMHCIVCRTKALTSNTLLSDSPLIQFLSTFLRSTRECIQGYYCNSCTVT